MRLRKLLLGSAAAVMAVGSASGSAQAADPMSGLVVTAAANYLASCESGKGIQFTDWCFYFSGSATQTYEFGWELDYGTSPATVTRETVNGDAYAWPPVVGQYPWNSSLSVKLGLTATRETSNGKTITVKVPIVGSGTTSLAISRPGGNTLTFTSSSLTLKVPANVATFTFKISSGPSSVAPFWPNLQTTVAWSGGNVDVKVVAQIGADIFNAGGVELAPEVDLTVDVDLGNVEVDLAARYDRVEVVGIVGGVSAYALEAALTASLGNADVTVGVKYAQNSNQWTGYNYDPAGGSTAGRYFRVYGKTVFTWDSNHRTTFEVAYNYGPVAFDGQLEFGVAHRIRPYGSSVLSITPALTYERAYNSVGTAIGAFSAKVTIAVPIN